MAFSVLRSLASVGRKWKPLSFPKVNFVRIPETQKVEEETIPGYLMSRYYPMSIGEVFQDQYQVVGKLGFGASSTAWLARDMSCKRYVVLKLFINSASMGRYADDELNIYKRIAQGSKKHPGYKAVRSLLDSFDVDGPDGRHRCLVHPPLWESLLASLHRNPILRLPAPVLAFALQRVFLALDFLHNECQIIHTDIKADNIMFAITDDSVFQAFEEEELRDPCPRKVVGGRTIYTSRALNIPSDWGSPVLCDLGSAVYGDVEHSEDIQPNIYRAPEVILEAPWTYSVDTWNVGCMVWDLFEGGNLFTGQDPKFHTYRGRAHLAEMVAVLGPPPLNLLARGRSSHKFFSEKGDFRADMPVLPLPVRISLGELESNLEGQDKASFLRLMMKMLQWEPE